MRTNVSYATNKLYDVRISLPAPPVTRTVLRLFFDVSLVAFGIDNMLGCHDLEKVASGDLLGLGSIGIPLVSALSPSLTRT